jgi:hypothetical protein
MFVSVAGCGKHSFWQAICTFASQDQPTTSCAIPAFFLLPFVPT